MPPVSKIAQLPDGYRQWLHQAFVKRAFGDIQAITDELNALMKEGGVAISIGKSAVGAESQKVKRAQEAIRATTEATKLLAESSRDDEDSRSEATMALIQSDVFELLLKIRETESEEGNEADRLALLVSAAKHIGGLSRARVNQAKWRTDVEARAKAAADKVAKIAKSGGLKPEQVDEIRRQILGVSKRTPVEGA